MERNKLFLSGPPGIGKTTVIRKVLGYLKLPAAGFFTQEIREGGRRAGFEIVNLDWKHRTMAHVEFNKRHRVGKYGVDLTAIDDLGTKSILNGLERQVLIIVDEIGPMEILSKNFQVAVIRAIRSSCPILGTIAKHRLSFIDQLKSLENIHLIEVNMKNRDEIPGMILRIFGIIQ